MFILGLVFYKNTTSSDFQEEEEDSGEEARLRKKKRKKKLGIKGGHLLFGGKVLLEDLHGNRRKP